MVSFFFFLIRVIPETSLVSGLLTLGPDFINRLKEKLEI